MSQVRDLLVLTAETLFDSNVTKEVIDGVERGEWPQDLWSSIVDNGLHDALVAEEDGGVGLSLADVVAILRVAGRHAAPVPLAESLVGHRVLADAGLDRPDALVTIAPLGESEEVRLKGADNAWSVSADLHAVPWGRHSEVIVVPVIAAGETRIVALPTAQCEVETIANLAGEPRDRVKASEVQLPGSSVSVPVSGDATLLRLGALSRVALMSGALESILEISVEYARQRIQFGRPIGRFQAMQQQLSVMAGEVAAAKAASDAAADAADRGDWDLPIAAAKARVGEAVDAATKVAHQVHGAIGFTHEHELHYRTRRLWAWRDEFGTEGAWCEIVGRQVLDAGGSGLWPLLAGSPQVLVTTRP